MTVIYNEFDPYAAEWCRNLIRDGHAPAGVVDERDLWNIAPLELMNYKQVHLCAGILGWPAALRLAGWDDDRYIFTCSAPCQGLSTAGKGLGFADERHLWPAIFHVIEALRPPVCVGEQVASSLGKIWLDLVFDDLEALAYTCWAVVLPVSVVGAPGERHRIFWLAYADEDRCDQRRSSLTTTGNDGSIGDGAEGIAAGFVSRGASVGVGYPISARHAQQLGERGALPEAVCPLPGQTAERTGSPVGGLADAHFEGENGRRVFRPGEGPREGDRPARQRFEGLGAHAGMALNSRIDSSDTIQPDHPWRDSDWLLCSDPGGPRWRPVETGTFPLSPGLPRGMGALGPGLARYATVAGADANSLRRAKRYRIGSLRGYGNAINIHVAAEWIRSWMDDIPQ